jgi:hypothetical protein
MSWGAIDDSAPTHPKFLGIDPAAIGLWAMGIAYCAKHLTNGIIAKEQVPLLVTGVSRQKAVALALVLVERRLWYDLGHAYRISGYLNRNPDRAKVIEARERARLRQQRLRERRNAITNGVTGGRRHALRGRGSYLVEPLPTTGEVVPLLRRTKLRVRARPSAAGHSWLRSAWTAPRL